VKRRKTITPFLILEVLGLMSAPLQARYSTVDTFPNAAAQCIGVHSYY